MWVGVVRVVSKVHALNICVSQAQIHNEGGQQWSPWKLDRDGLSATQWPTQWSVHSGQTGC